MCDGPLCTPAPAGRLTRRAAAARGFTLVEMLAVMTVIVILLSLVVPAFTKLTSANSLTKGVYDISGQLEQARAYAKANNTYTWVGFYEEAMGQNGVGPAIGHVVVSVVASKDGTALYTNNPTVPFVASNLIQIGKLTSIDNIHLTVLDNDKVPTRGLVPSAQDSTKLVNVPTLYQVGVLDPDSSNPPPDSSGSFDKDGNGNKNPVTFNYPLLAATQTTTPSSGNTVYTFVKIIQFSPLGDACKILDTPTRLMEIGLRPTHGTTLDTTSKNFAAVQIGGISGAVRIFRQ